MEMGGEGIIETNSLRGSRFKSNNIQHYRLKLGRRRQREEGYVKFQTSRSQICTVAFDILHHAAAKRDYSGFRRNVAWEN